MQSTDKQRFAGMLAALCDYYQRAPLDKPIVAIYWDGLNGYEYEDVSKAAKAHMSDPQHGDFFPKIADFARHLSAANPSAHPGEDEAWAICIRMAGPDETVIVTGQMLEAWASVSELIGRGDDYGARRGFVEVYRKAVATADAPPKWEVQMGDNKDIRAMRVAEAVKAGKLDEHFLAVHCLPAPTRGFAGLIAGSMESSVRLIAKDGEIVGEPVDMASRLESLRSALAPKSDDGIARREEERKVREANKISELAKIEARLKLNG